jgi:ADP-ribose pyrophosphatase YjhB (NUDIX family)
VGGYGLRKGLELGHSAGGYHRSISEQPVVTAFLARSDGRILVLRRSELASTYPGAWSAVSGYLESDDALEQAYVEIGEETSLGRELLELRAAAAPLVVAGPDGRRWLVHAFLFRCLEPERVTLNEENAEAKWVEPAALRLLSTVPALEETYAHVKLAEGGSG